MEPRDNVLGELHRRLQEGEIDHARGEPKREGSRMISARENLLRVFRGERPEWIPINGHVDQYNQPDRTGMDPELDAALGTVRWGDDSAIVFSRYLGLDIMEWFPGVCRSRRQRVTIETRQEGDETISVWRTPAGELRQRRRHSPEAGAWYTLEHLVKSADDLPALAAAFEDEVVELNPERVAQLAQRRELVGDDGVVGLRLPGTPLGMLLRFHAGVDTVAYVHADAPGDLAALLAVMEATHQQHYRLAATLDADALVAMDDTSTTTQSPAMFETYCLDYTDRVAAIAHAAGKPYFHHSCGLIRDLLGLYRQTKMDAVHGLQVPPLGDVTIRQAKEALGPDIIIYAALNQMFGPMGDWEMVARSVRDMFDGAAPGDRFMLGLAGDPSKDMPATQRLLAECRQYQNVEAMYS